MPSTNQKGSLFNSLRALADEIQEEKTAAARGVGREKRSEGPTPSDPGGYQGPTTHPIKNVSNNAQEASEGARSSENTSDVKADNPGASVDATSEATPGKDEQDKQQFNIGTQQSATGEDPSVEDAYKSGKDDPGSSHPARTDNNQLDGHKYASASFQEGHAKSAMLANQILADLANGFGSQLSKRAAEGGMKGHGDSDPSTETPTSNPSTEQGMDAVGGDAEGEHVQPGHGGGGGKSKESTFADKLKAAAATVAGGRHDAADEMQAGYELAAVLGIDKQAAAAGVQETIGATIRDAQLDADLFGSYYLPFVDRMQKAAMGDENSGEDHSEPGDAASGEGGSAAGGEGEGGGDPLAALAGGAGGGPPMDMGGGGLPGGEPSEEEAIAELVAALDELGIPLEALAGAGGGMEGGGMEGGGMGGPGGPPDAAGPMGGGGPPPGMEVAASHRSERQKLAAVARQYKLSGRYQIKEARDPRQRMLRDMMKSHVRELMGV